MTQQVRVVSDPDEGLIVSAAACRLPLVSRGRCASCLRQIALDGGGVVVVVCNRVTILNSLLQTKVRERDMLMSPPPPRTASIFYISGQLSLKGNLHFINPIW